MTEFVLAVISDVHGNRFALEAVLAEIDRLEPDLTVNLGDVVWGGADPAGAWKLLQERGFPTVRGNTDESVAGGKESGLGAWVRAQLPPVALPDLAALPTTLTVAGGEVLLAHGTPSNPDEQLLFENNEPVGREVLRRRLQGVPEAVKVIAVGHTHLEAVARFGGLLAVNVGAVSRQKDGLPDARWAVLRRHGPRWSAEFRATPYDVEGAARWAEAHAPKGAALARQFRTGLR